MKVDIILWNFLGITPAGMTVHSKDDILHLLDIHRRYFFTHRFHDSPRFTTFFLMVRRHYLGWKSSESWNFLNYTLPDYIKLLYTYTSSIDKGVVSPNLWHDFSQCKVKKLCMICIDPQYHCTRPHQTNLRSEQVAPGSVVSQNWPPCSSSSADVATAGYHESGKWLNRFI